VLRQSQDSHAVRHVHQCACAGDTAPARAARAAPRPERPRTPPDSPVACPAPTASVRRPGDGRRCGAAVCGGGRWVSNRHVTAPRQISCRAWVTWVRIQFPPFRWSRPAACRCCPPVLILSLPIFEQIGNSCANYKNPKHSETRRTDRPFDPPRAEERRRPRRARAGRQGEIRREPLGPHPVAQCTCCVVSD
jgi:hypothetical protein